LKPVNIETAGLARLFQLYVYTDLLTRIAAVLVPAFLAVAVHLAVEAVAGFVIVGMFASMTWAMPMAERPVVDIIPPGFVRRCGTVLVGAVSAGRKKDRHHTKHDK
jgi:hypothetical protein